MIPLKGVLQIKTNRLAALTFFVFCPLTKARFRRRRKTKKPKLSFRFFFAEKEGLISLIPFRGGPANKNQLPGGA